jgi:hypothetical protein
MFILIIMLLFSRLSPAEEQQPKSSNTSEELWKTIQGTFDLMSAYEKQSLLRNFYDFFCLVSSFPLDISLQQLFYWKSKVEGETHKKSLDALVLFLWLELKLGTISHQETLWSLLSIYKKLHTSFGENLE